MGMKQLEIVVKLEQDKEDQMRQELQSAQAFLVTNQQKLSDIYDYRKEYMKELQAKGMNGMEGNTFAQFNSFVSKLDQLVEQQLRVIDTAKQVVEQRQGFFIEQQRKRKAVEMLIDKERERQKIQEQKQEQRLADEVSIQQFFRRK